MTIFVEEAHVWNNEPQCSVETQGTSFKQLKATEPSFLQAVIIARAVTLELANV